jgi:hypothetical protein
MRSICRVSCKLILLCTLLGAVILEFPTKPVLAQGGMGIETKQSTVLRTGPDNKYSTVTKLPANRQMNAYKRSEDGKWVQVGFGTVDHQRGWILVSDLKASDVSSLPTVPTLSPSALKTLLKDYCKSPVAVPMAPAFVNTNVYDQSTNFFPIYVVKKGGGIPKIAADPQMRAFVRDVPTFVLCLGEEEITQTHNCPYKRAGTEERFAVPHFLRRILIEGFELHTGQRFYDYMVLGETACPVIVRGVPEKIEGKSPRPADLIYRFRFYTLGHRYNGP